MISQHNFPHLTRQDVLDSWGLILVCIGYAPTWLGLLSFARKAKFARGMFDRALAIAFEQRMLTSSDTDAFALFTESLALMRSPEFVPVNEAEANLLPRFKRACSRFTTAAQGFLEDGFSGWGKITLFGEPWFLPLQHGEPGAFRDALGEQPMEWWADYLNADW